ncbi:MAG TPA: hypothetical protein VH575_05985 [Gemmataceae bacterium]
MSVFRVTLEETFDLPDRYRRTVTGVAGGAFGDMEYAIQGTRGWIRQGRNPPQDFPLAEPLPLERHWHAILAQLLLLRSKDTELKYLGEKVKDGRQLAGISAHSPQAAGDLYFDQTTGLLARAVRPVPNVALGKDTAGEIGENIFDDYKEIQGVQYPLHSKATSSGMSLEVKITSLEFLDKIDDDIFAKPAVSRPPEPPTPPDEPPEERPSAEPPARWDVRFLVATLAAGSVVAVVWLIVRGSKGRKQETPPQ